MSCSDHSQVPRTSFERRSLVRRVANDWNTLAEMPRQPPFLPMPSAKSLHRNDKNAFEKHTYTYIYIYICMCIYTLQDLNFSDFRAPKVRQRNKKYRKDCCETENQKHTHTHQNKNISGTIFQIRKTEKNNKIWDHISGISGPWYILCFLFFFFCVCVCACVFCWSFWFSLSEMWYQTCCRLLCSCVCCFCCLGFLFVGIWETFSELANTFRNVGNFRKQILSKSCLEGPHSELIRQQLLLWTTHKHKHFKPTVTMQVVPSLDYCF